MLASMSRKAAGLPDISRPTSQPAGMPGRVCTSASFCARTLTARVTPSFSASSRRYGLRSVITDLNPYRLELAEKLGVTLAVNVRAQKLADVQTRPGMPAGCDV